MLLDNIRRECDRQKITISDLERRAGLAKNSIYKWSVTAPSVQKVKAAADVLGTTIDELLKRR